MPFKIQYRYRPAEYGDQLVRMYLLTNDKESKLGTTPLPDGMVRVFRDNGRDGLIYLARTADQVHPDRRQDRAEPRPRSGGDLRAGQAEDVAGQHLDAIGRRQRLPARSISRAFRSASTARSPAGTTTPSSPSGSATTRRSRSTWKSAARFPGHVVFRSELPAKNHDFQTVRVHGDREAGREGRSALRNRAAPRPQRQAAARGD